MIKIFGDYTPIANIPTEKIIKKLKRELFKRIWHFLGLRKIKKRLILDGKIIAEREEYFITRR